MSVVSTGLLGIQGLLGLVMVGAGGSKFVGVESQIEEFERYGYPPWVRFVTGSVETIAGLGLLVGLVMAPLLTLGGSLLVTVTMVGAVFTHVRIGDSTTKMIPPTILLVLALVVSWYHIGGLG